MIAKVCTGISSICLLMVLSFPAMAHMSGNHDLGVIGFFHFLTAVDHIIWCVPVILLLVLTFMRKKRVNQEVANQLVRKNQDAGAGQHVY